MSEFRVGGVYRQQDGALIQLLDSHAPATGTAWACRVGGTFGYGFRNLLTGEDTIAFEGGIRRLLPGELQQVNGEWVPMDPLATHHVSAAEQDAIDSAKCQPAHVSHCPDEAMKQRDLRPSFTSDAAKPFDSFGGGFVVTRGGQVACNNAQAKSWAQRLNDGSAICGSAHLLA